MPQNIRIRPAKNEDLDKVFDLTCEMQEHLLDKDAFKLVFDEYLFRENVRLWVAEIDGNVVGVLSLHFQNQLHHAGCIAEVVELAVEGTHRSKGIGKLLLREAEVAAMEKGCQVLELSTNQRRKQAHAFYLREGMECTHYKFTKALEKND